MATIYCKVEQKGKLTFYLEEGGKDYLLFIQKYKKSTKEYFCKGRPISGVFNMARIYSTATRKTIERLIPTIRYVEKEYGISVLKSSEKKNCKKEIPYKRQKFSLRAFYQDAAEAI